MTDFYLTQILKKNSTHPIIVEGGLEKEMMGPHVVFLSADVKKSALSSCAFWKTLFAGCDLSKQTFLVIEGLEKLSASDQEKFVPLLARRRMGSERLSDRVTMLIPVSDQHKISETVRSLCVIWVVR